MTQLSSLASIRSGYPFRSGIEPNPEGTVAVIQMRDVDYGTCRLAGTPSRVRDISKPETHLLRPGEILFVAKGTTNVAVCLGADIGPAVAAPAFFVITPTSPEVLPGYLAWFINQKPAQSYLLGLARGTRLPIITKGMIEALEVPIPPPRVQQTIMELDRLARRERELLERIGARRGQLIELTTLNALR